MSSVLQKLELGHGSWHISKTETKGLIHLHATAVNHINISINLLSSQNKQRSKHSQFSLRVLLNLSVAMVNDERMRIGCWQNYTAVLRARLVPVPLHLPQIPHELAWD
jgi:hypothetical protein